VAFGERGRWPFSNASGTVQAVVILRIASPWDILESGSMLIEYVKEQAAWRWLRAQEHPEDGRNARSVRGLKELAAYLEARPNDPSLVAIEASLRKYDGGNFSLAEKVAREVGLFRFHDPTETCRAFLKRLAEVVERMEELANRPNSNI
jgi:hypothetical protein